MKRENILYTFIGGHPLNEVRNELSNSILESLDITTSHKVICFILLPIRNNVVNSVLRSNDSRINRGDPLKDIYR